MDYHKADGREPDGRESDGREADDTSGVELKAIQQNGTNGLMQFGQFIQSAQNADVLKFAQTDVLEAAEFAKEQTVKTIKYYRHYVDSVLLHQMSESM
jgi:hypothetical protein